MTTIEVLNITYENNRIQECKIIIAGKEFNATWEDPEYSVTDKKDKKDSKAREDSDSDEEPITEEQSEEKSRESKNKYTENTKIRANSRQAEIKMVQENISNLKSRTDRLIKPTLKAKQAKE